MRSYAMGQAGDFPLTLTPTGAVWTIPAGPATIRYTITAKDGVWHEVGERVVEGQPPDSVLRDDAQADRRQQLAALGRSRRTSLRGEYRDDPAEWLIGKA
jgi:hypothetical protein